MSKTKVLSFLLKALCLPLVWGSLYPPHLHGGNSIVLFTTSPTGTKTEYQCNGADFQHLVTTIQSSEKSNQTISSLEDGQFVEKRVPVMRYERTTLIDNSSTLSAQEEAWQLVSTSFIKREVGNIIRTGTIQIDDPSKFYQLKAGNSVSYNFTETRINKNIEGAQVRTVTFEVTLKAEAKEQKAWGKEKLDVYVIQEVKKQIRPPSSYESTYTTYYSPKLRSAIKSEFIDTNNRQWSCVLEKYEPPSTAN